MQRRISVSDICISLISVTPDHCPPFSERLTSMNYLHKLSYLWLPVGFGQCRAPGRDKRKGRMWGLGYSPPFPTRGSLETEGLLPLKLSAPGKRALHTALCPSVLATVPPLTLVVALLLVSMSCVPLLPPCTFVHPPFSKHFLNDHNLKMQYFSCQNPN